MCSIGFVQIILDHLSRNKGDLGSATEQLAINLNLARFFFLALDFWLICVQEISSGFLFENPFIFLFTKLGHYIRKSVSANKLDIWLYCFSLLMC